MDTAVGDEDESSVSALRPAERPAERPATHSALYFAAESAACSRRWRQLGAWTAGLAGTVPERWFAVLRGRGVGHAVHPATTDWAHAMWLSTSVLDVFGGRRSARPAQRLLAVGLAGWVPAMATGVADWSYAARRPREHAAGAAHGAAMVAAIALYGSSYVARRRRHRGVGAGLALTAGVVATVGDYLGGYLSLGRGTGVAVTRGQRDGAPEGPRNPFFRAAVGIEDERRLDAFAKAAQAAAETLLPPGRVKNALTGHWLGHSLHPLLTDLPLGAWMGASLLDVIGGRNARQASQRLVAFGLVTAIPTAAAGLSEWVDTEPPEKRVGVVHAAFNAAGWSLYATSWVARRRRRHSLGVAAGIAGGVAAIASGYLGGHLSLARGVGVSSASDADVPDRWVPVATDHPISSATVIGHAGDVPVVVSLDDAGTHGVVATCTHRGGALHLGHFDGGCVTCPRHGSRFRLSDGAVIRGPASVPAVTLDARRVDAHVEVRRQP